MQNSPYLCIRMYVRATRNDTPVLNRLQFSYAHMYKNTSLWWHPQKRPQNAL
jgi:hypothetical protein